MCSFGDWVALSDVCDELTASLIAPEVSDGVIAPGYTEKALEILKAKRKGTYNVVAINPEYVPKKQEIKEEMNANLDRGAHEMEAVDKADSVYGKDATLAASNVGTIADELRADIYGSLNRMLNGEFDRDEARETFSKMVLLELVKRGRSFDEITGDLMAGNVESALAEKPEALMKTMRENPYIKAVCKNLTLDAFRQFVVNDGAKALADKIIGAAKEYNPDANVNELQLQNVQEVQKQQSVPMI
jgi:hypothetical protein